MVIRLHEALERLAEFDSRKAQVVEMRYFGGLTAEEIAAVLHISPQSVNRDWSLAKAWLVREMNREEWRWSPSAGRQLSRSIKEHSNTILTSARHGFSKPAGLTPFCSKRLNRCLPMRRCTFVEPFRASGDGKALGSHRRKFRYRFTGVERAAATDSGIASAAAGTTSALPSFIGPYRILRLLGEGGMGVVYEAEQEHPRRTVALKIIKSGLSRSQANPALRARITGARTPAASRDCPDLRSRNR